jgi:hypothetical protein
MGTRWDTFWLQTGDAVPRVSAPSALIARKPCRSSQGSMDMLDVAASHSKPLVSSTQESETVLLPYAYRAQRWHWLALPTMDLLRKSCLFDRMPFPVLVHFFCCHLPTRIG